MTYMCLSMGGQVLTLLAGFLLTEVSQANAGELPIISAIRLRCENLDSPRTIDKKHPNFSWLCQSSTPAERGQIQTAYQIIVADSPDAVVKDDGNLWNAGRRNRRNLEGEQRSADSLRYHGRRSV